MVINGWFHRFNQFGHRIISIIKIEQLFKTIDVISKLFLFEISSFHFSFSYAGVTNIELAYTQLDVNQCPGDHFRNVYANSAACDRNAFVCSSKFIPISFIDLVHSVNLSMVLIYKVVVINVLVILIFVIHPTFVFLIDRRLINILQECHPSVNQFVC